MTAGAGADLAGRLRDRDLSAAPAVLNLVESRSPDAREEIDALLQALSPAALGGEAPAHIVGVTGPPGVGKSSLLSRLVAAWRADGRTVAVLAVDPSSRRSGGSLLGDRARIETAPGDRGVFIRSTAAGGRLGGLAPATRAAAGALAAAFDVVVIETVGVGQSETEVADVADTVAVVVQPASGDVLQFLKAGIMEVPDVLVVTKSDLGRLADRAVADLRAALRALGAGDTGDRGRVLGGAARRGSTSWSTPSTRHRSSLDLPAPGAASARDGCTRSATSWPSTASAGCARSAAAGTRRTVAAEQDPAPDVPGASAARALGGPTCGQCGRPCRSCSASRPSHAS